MRTRLSIVFAGTCAAVILACLAMHTRASDTSSRPIQEPARETPSSMESVSIVDLLARPNAYDGKKVRIKGYLHVKFEDCSVFMTKEHADYLMGKYGLWVHFKRGDVNQTGFDCKYVLLEGVFNKSARATGA